MSVDYLIMCIGNREGGDDAIGPLIADTLSHRLADSLVIDCGTTPENYTAVVKRQKPKTLILIDAADMGLVEGSIRTIPKEKIGTMHISTHGIPLSVLMNYLEKETEQIIFIGIQPKHMSGPMSIPVKKAATLLIELLRNKQLDQIKTLQ